MALRAYEEGGTRFVETREQGQKLAERPGRRSTGRSLCTEAGLVLRIRWAIPHAIKGIPTMRRGGER